jgi:hypothetical protein
MVTNEIQKHEEWCRDVVGAAGDVRAELTTASDVRTAWTEYFHTPAPPNIPINALRLALSYRVTVLAAKHYGLLEFGDALLAHDHGFSLKDRYATALSYASASDPDGYAADGSINTDSHLLLIHFPAFEMVRRQVTPACKAE